MTNRTFLTLLICGIIAALLFSGPELIAENDDAVDRSHPLMLTLTLRDGSVLLGTMPKDADFDFVAPFGEVSIPMNLVRRIRFKNDLETARIDFRNGDVLTGVFEIEHFDLDSLLGQVHPAPSVIRSLEVTDPSRIAASAKSSPDERFELVTVDATKNQVRPLVTRIRVQEGDWIVLEPFPQDKWTGGGSKTRVDCDFMGYADRANNWMRLHYQIGSQAPVPVVAGREYCIENDGILKLFCHDGRPGDNKGRVRVLIKVSK
jgi:hypothetical protein